MSPQDFITRLEHQLVEAAERDLAASPARRRIVSLGERLRPCRVLTALPLAAAALLVGVIAAVVLSLGGEQPRVEAGGPLPAGTDGLTVEPLGTAPQPGTAIPLPGTPGPKGAPRVPPATRSVIPIPPASPGAPSGTPPTPTPAGTSVFVLYGTTRNGVAAAAAKRLERRGVVVEGIGNAPTAPIPRSVVYAATPRRGQAVAELLGLPSAPGPVPRRLREAAGGADVVVLLGADFPKGKDRRVTLTGPDGARGVVVFSGSGGLSFTATGLPPSNRYFLWGESRTGRTVPIGFATYDRKRRQVAGALIDLAGRPADTLGRIFLTRERTRTPKRPGKVVLDSGRIGG